MMADIMVGLLIAIQVVPEDASLADAA